MLTSPENPFIKMVLSLKRKKGRIKNRLFLAEGPHLVQEAFNAGFSLKGLIVASDSFNEDLDSLISQARDLRITIYQVAPRLFQRLAETETPQGIMALAVLPEHSDKWPPSQGYLGLVLNGIQDPGNLGALIRTAWGAGIKEIFITPGVTDPYSGKTARASQGGIFHLQIHTRSTEEIIEWTMRNQVNLWVGDAKAKQVYFHQDLTAPGLFVLGAEASGVDPLFMGAGIPVKIQLPGGVDSLNVAISGAIMLFEALRQREIAGHQ